LSTQLLDEIAKIGGIGHFRLKRKER
jgi:hypothetical protein